MLNKDLKITMLLPLLFVGAANANNPAANQGEAVYYSWKPDLAVWKKGGFAGVIIGPKQHGYEFKNYEMQVININRRTYTEAFNIVDSSQIQIHFEVAFGVRPDPNPERIRDLVERFGGANWYNAIAREPLKTFVRDAIGGQDSQTLSTTQDRVQTAIFERAQAWIQRSDLPIVLDSVSVGNFQFPEKISEAAAEKQANRQRLEAKTTLLEIAHKDAEIAAANAKGIRDSQDIINQTLSPLYVSHEMIKAMEAIASKQGNIIMIVPTGPNGVPVFNNLQLTPAGPATIESAK